MMSNKEVDFFLSIRKQFPQLHTHPSLVYLDSAATTLKPQRVIDCLTNFYSNDYATVNRGLYKAAREASNRYEASRKLVAQLLNASSEEEVIFTKGTTDSLNLLADLFLHSILTTKSKIILSQMEHHSNIVPWQMAAKRAGCSLLVIPLTSKGELDLDFLEAELKKGDVTLVSLCHVSNVLGTINPIRTIADLCHRFGAYLSVDGAQSAPHMLSDVQALGCDFFCFSSHKIYGPTALGVLWGKKEHLETLSPTRGGGGMIDTVTFAQTTWGPLPSKFEPGTPPIAEVIGLGEAIRFINDIGLTRIFEWEHALTEYLRKQLASIDEVLFIGNTTPRGALQSMSFKTAHPLDVATLLDLKEIAVRSGHLCCQPLLNSLQTSSVLRVSFGVYNTFDECDTFVNALKEALLKLK